VTHTNEVQLWDAVSGDQFTIFDRNHIAEAMMVRKITYLLVVVSKFALELNCARHVSRKVNGYLILLQRSNPDAVYVTGFYATQSTIPLGLFTCSLSGYGTNLHTFFPSATAGVISVTCSNAKQKSALYVLISVIYLLVQNLLEISSYLWK
jgi:hypothetical protein